MNFAPITDQGRTIAERLDHTLLKAEATREQVLALCREAVHYGFAAVCVSPAMLKQAAQELAGSPVKPGTVIGFPMGYSTSRIKAAEARDAVKNGAHELDMVQAIGALKSGDRRTVLKDIQCVVRAAEGRTVKVILETCLLTNEEKIIACRLVIEAGAHFVKTSTGLAGGGATVEDIRLMRSTVGPDFGVKASGGIKTLAATLEMIRAGATRIGTSSAVAIVTGQS